MTLKTWQEAKKAHTERLAWCCRFGEVLLMLEQAGAPPPLRVGAAHVDWPGPLDIRLRIGLMDDTVFCSTVFGADGVARDPAELQRLLPDWVATIKRFLSTEEKKT